MSVGEKTAIGLTAIEFNKQGNLSEYEEYGKDVETSGGGQFLDKCLSLTSI